MTGTAVHTSWDGVKRGFWRAQPMAVGVFVYGVAFGLLAREAGILLAEASAMSMAVYSGSAQLAAASAITLTGIDGGGLGGIGAIVAAILLLNARYLLYSAALWPWLSKTPARVTYPTLFVLGDGNWVLSMAAYNAGERDAGFLLGSGLASFVPWLLGTLLGASAGALLADPKLLGLDFLLVAFSAAMGIGLARAPLPWPNILAAAATALVVDRLAPGGWTIVAAGIAGGIATALTHRPSTRAKS
ncbi:MAG: AzlC family ABC transporter permease [Azospirillum sp.]|nr:AzlC family ABC transporter permease [Azospirillum sp.]MCA3267945.1 AzlC family ABC transporter permease [Azospirillum sp.]MCZ8123186.1 AzlC family ABC transporter permease [Magnetospirillum sp.]